MIVRDFKAGDRTAAEQIYALYWTDKEFLKELSDELTRRRPYFLRTFSISLPFASSSTSLSR